MRDLRIIMQGSPCTLNFMDTSLLTVEEAIRRQETKEDYCPTCDPRPTGGIITKY